MLRSCLPVLLLISVSMAAIADDFTKANTTDTGLAADRLARIDSLMEAHVEQGDFVGAVGLIVRDGQLAYLNAWGDADRESGREMTPDTIFRIYSMSKPITSVALMMLYEEGKFGLNDPVSRYLPAFKDMKVLVQNVPVEPREGSWLEDDRDRIEIDPETYDLVDAEREMTVRDLLRHTSGLTYGFFGNTIVDQMYRKSGILRDQDSLEAFVDALGELPLQFQPGTRWHYSVSTDVIGRLIEVLSDMPLDEYLHSRIFEPLGMTDTGFHVPEADTGRFAQMYTPNDDGVLEISDAELSESYLPDAPFFSGGGGLVSTARDYARFCQALLNGGELEGHRILSPKTIELMTASHLSGIEESMSGGGYTFGLGFAVSEDIGMAAAPGTEGEFNWGGAAGTKFWIDPEEDMAGVFMIQILPHPYNFGTQFRNLSYMAIVEQNAR
jgi:CubicO group peptidase (beta-lactamase class C family)